MQTLVIALAAVAHAAFLTVIVMKIDDIRWELKKLNARANTPARWDGK